MPLKCLHFSDAPIHDLHNQCYLNGISKNPNGLWFSPFEHDSDGGYTYWKYQNEERALKIDANLNVTLDESETAEPLSLYFLLTEPLYLQILDVSANVPLTIRMRSHFATI